MKYSFTMPLPIGENNSTIFGVVLGRLSSYLTETKRKQIQENRIRRDIEQLYSMNDGQLSDIGITRMDIPHVVRYGSP
jgi:uncharacterized protein YjiS (DUF1127 family)